MFVALPATSCSFHPHSRVAATLSDVESYINDRPDSALAVLEGVDTTALTTRALRARYSLLRTMAQAKNYRDLTVPGLIDDAAAWYARHGSADEKMKTLYYLGCIAQANGDLNGAVVYYTMAEEYAENVIDKHTLGLLYLAKATAYGAVYNIEKEAEYTEKGWGVFRETEDPMQEMALGQVAISCFGLKEWARADSLFLIGINASSSNSYAMSILLSNYARMKVLKPEPDPEAALALLDRMRIEFGYPLSLRDVGVYAYALVLSGCGPEAEGLLDQLKERASSSPLEVESWLSRCALVAGDFKQAYESLSRAHAAEESVIQSVLSDSVTEAVAAYHEMAGRQKRMQYRINIAILLIVLLALSLSLVLSLLRRNKLVEEKTRVLDICASLEKEAAEQENQTVNLQSQLNRFKEIVRQERVLRFRQAGRLRSSIWRLDHRGLPSWVKEDPDMAAIKEELSYIYDLDDSGEILVKRLDRELDGAIDSLSEALNLKNKRKEQLFMCCTLLDLPSDVVAAKLGITPNNVRVKKHRLKEQIAKLNDPEYDALFDIRR